MHSHTSHVFSDRSVVQLNLALAVLVGEFVSFTGASYRIFSWGNLCGEEDLNLKDEDVFKATNHCIVL